MSIQVEFSDEVVVASGEERDTFARHVMIYTLGHLYQQGKISSGIGAQMLGCDRLEFYHLLSENGFAIIDYPPDELHAEAASSRQIAASRRQQ